MAKYGLIRGHGYSDPGATGNGTNERDFLTPVVERIAQYLSNDIVYELSRDAFQDKSVVKWARENGVEQVIEFHLDSGGSVGHIIVTDRYPIDDVDTRCEQVVSKHFGSRGFSKRNDLYNLNVCADAGIAYRLVEICPVTNAEDMQYFSAHIDEVARDFAVAISGGEVGEATPVQPSTPPQQTAGYYPPKHYAYGFDCPRVGGVSAWHDAHVDDGMAFYPNEKLFYVNANRYDTTDKGKYCKYFTFEKGAWVMTWNGITYMTDGEDVVVIDIDGTGAVNPNNGYWAKY